MCMATFDAVPNHGGLIGHGGSNSKNNDEKKAEVRRHTNVTDIPCCF